jgi:hypothetical protein
MRISITREAVKVFRFFSSLLARGAISFNLVQLARFAGRKMGCARAKRTAVFIVDSATGYLCRFIFFFSLRPSRIINIKCWLCTHYCIPRNARLVSATKPNRGQQKLLWVDWSLGRSVNCRALLSSPLTSSRGTTHSSYTRVPPDLNGAIIYTSKWGRCNTQVALG